MRTPTSALKENDLFHCTSLGPGAANELDRRIARGDIDPNTGMEDVREDIAQEFKTVLQDKIGSSAPLALGSSDPK